MVLAALGAAAGQYAMSKIQANSANSAQKKSELRGAIISDWLAQQSFNRQKDWEKERATHAHQWEMQDLKDAGLNPALTAMGGSGATTGSIGGTAGYSPSTAKGINMGNITDYLKNSRENRLADYQTEMMSANSAKAVQETANLAAENPYISKREKAKLGQIQADTAKSYAEAAKNRVEAETTSKIMDYKVSQEFGKASQELYQGRLSDVKADFLNKYNISPDAAYQIGADGLKTLSILAGAGMGKKALSAVGKAILKKTSAKALNFSNFPR